MQQHEKKSDQVNRTRGPRCGGSNSSGNWRFRLKSPKHVLILVVTGRGPNPNYILSSTSSNICTSTTSTNSTSTTNGISCVEGWTIECVCGNQERATCMRTFLLWLDDHPPIRVNELEFKPFIYVGHIYI